MVPFISEDMCRFNHTIISAVKFTQTQRYILNQIEDIPQKSPRISLKTWRELIKKVWEVDPLTCPRCGSDLPAIASSGEAGGDEDYQPDPGS